MTTQPPASKTKPEAASAAGLTPTAAWPRRVAVSGAAVIGVFTYAIKVTAGTAPRPAGPQARRIERSVTLATIIALAAVFILPIIVIAAGRSDWVLPSIVITIGPLLLSRGHLVHVPRQRLAGWALIAGPVILVATMSGPALAVTTGFAAGVILLGAAAAEFHDLAGIRPARPEPSAKTR